VYYALTVLAVGLLAYTHYLLPAACLAFLIIVHESGHFFVARWCSMQVERFSLGFGPAIPGLSWMSKQGTKFQLAPLPFGGFVEIRGMNVMDEIDPEDARSYPNRPTWQRVLTIFAGPAMNYVSAIVIAFILYNCNGVPRSHPYNTVDAVQDGSPAQGKLQLDDRILAVDGIAVWGNSGAGLGITQAVLAKQAPVSLTVRRGEQILHLTMAQPVAAPRMDMDPVTPYLGGRYWSNALGILWNPNTSVASFASTSPAQGVLKPDDFILEVDGMPVSGDGDSPGLTPMIMAKHGAPVDLTVSRGDQTLHVTITPTITTAPGSPWQVMYALKILKKPDMVPISTFEATWRALRYPIAQSKLIGQTLYKVVTGEEAADPGGAPRIMAELRDAAKRGWVDLLELLAILNVYLGLFNLLPLPALDGGRLVFLIYEMITRRRPNAKIEAMVHMGGVMVLLVAMVLVTLHDFGAF
jgi:regulator of sigma E protease